MLSAEQERSRGELQLFTLGIQSRTGDANRQTTNPMGAFPGWRCVRQFGSHDEL